ncbi:DNA cytosine methyltransferase [Acetobacteraceae bacterium]|nr:DNA cytosine methyltransferase [Acetobacteraceae bacterium]
MDLFAGIGGLRLGFQFAFPEAKCVFSSEWDKNAQITYEVNFEEKPHGDITKIKAEDIPQHDVLLAGFPCQAFSVAGYRKGFEDEKGRGNLFFEIVRILEHHAPKVIFLENVKNLKTHDNGNTIKVIYRELKRLGYFVKDSVLNAMEVGNLPQNRERIFIIGFLEEKICDAFQFPKKQPLTQSIHACLVSGKVDEKYFYNKNALYSTLQESIVSRDTLYQWRRKYVRENKNNVCPTLTANMGMGGHNVPLILAKKGIRKLTPRECANFQGFPKSYILPPLADSHLYKQFGNSVAVPVIEAIAKQIKDVL